MINSESNSILSQNSVQQQAVDGNFPESNKNERFKIQINTHKLSNCYDRKPTDNEVAIIQYFENWITKNCDVQYFLTEVVLKGKTFRFGVKIGTVLEKDKKTGKLKHTQPKSTIKECCGFCLDFDGKEVQIPSFEEIIKDEFFQKNAVFAYTTPSYIEGVLEKYRVLFLFESSHPWQLVEQIIAAFIARYPADKGCKDAGRLWFSSARNGKHHVFNLDNRINIDQLIADGILAEDVMKVTLLSEESEEDEQKPKPVLKTAPSESKLLNPDDYDVQKQIEAIEQQNPGITSKVLQHLHDEVFIGKLGGDITKLYCLFQHDLREIPVDKPGMICKWEGANPWKPPTTDNPTSFVISYLEGQLPGFNDRSGNFSSHHRLKDKEQHGGSFLDYYWFFNSHKYTGTLQENFKQLVHDICDYFEAPRFDFRSGKKSKRQITLDLIRKKLGSRLAFNEMNLKPELDGDPINFDIIVHTLGEKFGIETSSTLAQTGILYLALENSYHPVRNYLLQVAEKYPVESVEGMLNKLSTKYFGTNKDIYDIYVRKMLISAVARVFDPGCGVKTVLILQSDKQDVRKSTWFRDLFGGKWFNDNVNVGDVTNKDDRQLINAFWGHEIAEIDRLFKKADRSNLKTFISETSDNFRPPYSRDVKQHPRTSIFVGSTNETEILHDPTGSVRFWVIPVAVKKIDTDLVVEERDKLWAAAYHTYQASRHLRACWALTDEEACLRDESNKSFDSSDTWETNILAFAEQFEEISIPMILAKALNIPVERHDKKNQMRVGDILKKNGWSKHKNQKRLCGQKFAIWSNPNSDYDGKPLKTFEDAYRETVNILFPNSDLSSVSSY